MKLNPDCVRDTLMQIEEMQTIQTQNTIRILWARNLQDSSLRDRYSREDIFYSIKQLADSGYIHATPKAYIRNMDYEIRDIAPKGHDFLANTRDNEIWHETKDKAQGAGIKSFTLDILSQLAAAIITNRLGI